MEKSVNRSVCFWPEDWAKIKAMAAASGISANEFVRRSALVKKVLPLERWRVIAYINKALGFMNEGKLADLKATLLACREEVAGDGRNN